jgi:hypothetical protein
MRDSVQVYTGVGYIRTRPRDFAMGESHSLQSGHHLSYTGRRVVSTASKKRRAKHVTLRRVRSKSRR